MKKASLAIVAIALALTACGGSKKAESVEETKTASVETVAERTIASGEAGSNTETAEAPSLAETLVLDHEGLKITAKELDMNGSLGPTLRLFIENETNRNVTVQVRDMSVNGCMIAPLLSSAVGKGETKEDGIGFSARALKLGGIDTFAELTFRFCVLDSETLDKIYESEPVTLRTSASEGYQERVDDSGTLAYEKEGVKIVVKGPIERENGFGPGILLYIENKSDKKIAIHATDVAVNDAGLEPIFSPEIAPGKHAVEAMTFFDDQLDNKKISSVRKAAFKCLIVDAESAETIKETDLIQVKF